jgi:hypothetical protein
MGSIEGWGGVMHCGVDAVKIKEKKQHFNSRGLCSCVKGAKSPVLRKTQL